MRLCCRWIPAVRLTAISDFKCYPRWLQKTRKKKTHLPVRFRHGWKRSDWTGIASNIRDNTSACLRRRASKSEMNWSRYFRRLVNEVAHFRRSQMSHDQVGWSRVKLVQLFSIVCQRGSSTHHWYTVNRRGKLLPVCGRLFGKLPKSAKMGFWKVLRGA